MTRAIRGESLSGQIASLQVSSADLHKRVAALEAAHELAQLEGLKRHEDLKAYIREHTDNVAALIGRYHIDATRERQEQGKLLELLLRHVGIEGLEGTPAAQKPE